jgi:predicted MFS family arabinose efflux permease
MASATYLGPALGVLATFLLDDLGVNRTEIGLLISATILVAAAISPLAGGLVDSLGGRGGVGVVYVTSAIGFLGVAVSPNFWWMLVPVTVAALAQGASNPATNKLIAVHAEAGRRGTLTGIKQSGVQAGTFLGGALVPAGALAFGWRWTLVLVALVPLVGLLLSWFALPADRPAREERPDTSERVLSPAILFLAVYGGLMGFGAAYTFLVPLFAEEALGLSETLAGFAAGVIGLTALFGRITWAQVAERTDRFGLMLFLLAVGSIAATAVLMSATSIGVSLLWVGVILTGVSSSSWNSVAMLAVIHHAGDARAGRGSRIVMLGFLVGLGVAPPIMGWTVDEFGTYLWVWVMAMVALVLAAGLSAWWVFMYRTARPAD